MLFFAIFTQIAYSQVNSELIESGDYFYKNCKFKEADSIFTKILDSKFPINPKIFLKLAKIELEKNNDVKALYYLDTYNQYQPSEHVLKEMLNIAEKNNFEGYENSTYNYFIFLYKKYAAFALIGILVLIVYLLFYFYKKRKANEIMGARHFIVISLLILSLLFLTNAEDRISDAIVETDNALLRSQPSAIGEVKGKLSRGTKISFINSNDIWLSVIIDKTLYYVKDSDVLIIKK